MQASFRGVRDGVQNRGVSATVSRIVAKRVLPAGWFDAALVVVLLAITSMAALSLSAGARRTATSFDRFLESSEPWDLSLGGAPEDQERRIGELRQSPAVAAMVPLPWVGEIDVGAPAGSAGVAIDIDGELRSFTNARVRDGRLPDDEASDQIVLGTSLAERLGVGVGDEVSVQLFDDTRTALSVAAVIVTINDFPSLTSLPMGTAVVPQGFARAHPDAVVVDGQTWLVRLADSADRMGSFRSAMQSAGLADVDVVTETAELRDGMQRILRMQAFALWTTAAIAGIAGLVVTYQVLRRAAIGVAPALATMRHLGARRGELCVSGVLRGALLGVIAATLGCVSAVAVSPLFPRGVARLADPNPGMHGDVVVLAIGAVSVLVAAAGLGALAVWSATRPQRPDSVRIVRVPGSGPVGFGLRVALEPDRGGVRALRPGLLGVGVIAAMLIAVATLGSSFDQLLVRPELSGGWWDAFIAPEGDDDDELAQGIENLVTTLRAEPEIDGLARGGWFSDTTIDGVPVPTMHLEPRAGIDPAMRSGQAPVGPNEIALASATMRQLDAELGDDVELELRSQDEPGPPIRVTVVGEVALTSPLFFDLGPGEGALVSRAVVERWSPQMAAVTPLLLRFPAGVDPAAGLATVLDGLGPARTTSFARADRGDVTALHDLSSVPWLLALGVSGLTLATLSQRVVTSVRRHRRDYGVMRTLGATKRQVRLGVTAQGSAVTVVAFAIGVPLGLLLAAVGWRLIAKELIVVPEIHVAWGPLAATALVIVGLTLVVTLVVCHATQRDRPAALLHAE